MFGNPYIDERLIKLRQEELLAESKRIHMIQSIEQKASAKTDWMSPLILFLADKLIQSGEILKKRWSSQIGESNGFATSLNGK